MKKIILAAVMALGIFHLSAQNKMGYIDTQELISLMPETGKADSTLKEYQQSLAQQGQDMGKEADEKTDKFVKDSINMNASTKDIKRKEILELYQKAQNWQQTAQEMYNQKAQSLIIPIRAKAMEAIKAVAKENGYGYVFDVSTGSLLVMPPGDELLPLVKRKLGIVDKPATNPTTPVKRN